MSSQPELTDDELRLCDEGYDPSDFGWFQNAVLTDSGDIEYKWEKSEETASDALAEDEDLHPAQVEYFHLFGHYEEREWKRKHVESQLKQEKKKLEKEKEAREYAERQLKNESSMACRMCMDRTRDTLFEPCRHLAVCAECWANWTQKKKKPCLICNKEVNSATKLFVA